MDDVVSDDDMFASPAEASVGRGQRGLFFFHFCILAERLSGEGKETSLSVSLPPFPPSLPHLLPIYCRP
jgi:hypothetical protein